MKRLVLQFRKEKETKGTYRYQDQEGRSGDTVVGSLYVRKGAFGDSPPDRLQVIIEPPPA